MNEDNIQEQEQIKRDDIQNKGQQASKPRILSSFNNLRVYPFTKTNEIQEECSILEKETPILDSNLSSPQNNKIGKLNPQLRNIQMQHQRDKYNRHYSVDASKFQSQQFISPSQQKEAVLENEIEIDNSDTKRWQINTNQELNPQTEFNTDKVPATMGDFLSNSRNFTNVQANKIRGDVKKRHSEYVNLTSKMGSVVPFPRINRRNGVAPLNESTKQLLVQNQAQSDTVSQTVENQQSANNNGIPSFIINKKLSLSWRFINILVLIQTLINKLKLMGSQYKYTKLNEAHFNYINDNSHIQVERKNIYQTPFLMIKEYLTDLRIIKWLGKVQVLQPEQVIVILWKIFILIIIVSQILYIPIKIAFFDFSPGLTELNQTLLMRIPLAACILDIFINFNLAFFTAEGVVIQDRQGIISNYMGFTFWLDLITTISLMLSDFHYPDLCFFLRIFQIHKMVSFLDERFQMSQRFNTPFTLIKLIATIIILAHIFGCGFYYMSLYDPSYNWVLKLGLKNAHWGTLYLKSVYFIIITMITVGFGDITPINNAETIYILGIALLSCFQFGYTVNVIGSLFQEKAQQEAIIKQNFKHFIFNILKQALYLNNNKNQLNRIDQNSFIRKDHTFLFIIKKNQFQFIRSQKYQISTYMRQRMIILKNLDYIQTQQIDAPEQGLSILDKVSENLKSQVRFDFYWRILKNQPLLNHYFSQNFLKALTQVMTEKTYIPGEFVYQINQVSQTYSMFILLKGQVDQTIHSLQERSSKKKFIVLSKKSGDIFGYFSFFTSQPRETDCECLVTSHIVSCTQEDFLSIAKQFPNDYEKYCLLRDQIIYYQKDKDMKCIACQKYGHCIIDCPFVHMVNYKSLVIEKQNYSEDNKRDTNYNRKQDKKHQTFLELNKTKNDLKKIQFLRERKQRKSALYNTYLMHTKTMQPNLQEHQERHDESSLDSSDLSDYKLELQLDEEKQILKRQSKNFPFLSSYYDKHFYQRHSRIKFKDNQLVLQTSQSDSVYEDSQESSESEGTVYLNTINLYKDKHIGFQINDYDDNSYNLDQIQNNNYSYQTLNSSLNDKINTILQNQKKQIKKSIKYKNLRQKNPFRPDSAPQNKKKQKKQNYQDKGQQRMSDFQTRPSSSTIYNKRISSDSEESLNSEILYSKNQINENQPFFQEKNRITPTIQSLNQIQPFQQDSKQQLYPSKDKMSSQDFQKIKEDKQTDNQQENHQKLINANRECQPENGQIQSQDSQSNSLTIQNELKSQTSHSSSSDLSESNESKKIENNQKQQSIKNINKNQSITQIKLKNPTLQLQQLKKNFEKQDSEEDLQLPSQQNDNRPKNTSFLDDNDNQVSPILSCIKKYKNDIQIPLQSESNEFELVQNEINKDQQYKSSQFKCKQKIENRKMVKKQNTSILSKKETNMSTKNTQASCRSERVIQNNSQINLIKNEKQNEVKRSSLKQRTKKMSIHPNNEQQNEQKTNNQNQPQKDQTKKNNDNQQNQDDHTQKIEEKEYFMINQFEKMKIYKIYFPNNNVTSVLEHNNRCQIKKHFLMNRQQYGTINKNQQNIMSVVNVMKKRLMQKHAHSSAISAN